MLHELCHNAISPHNASFYKLWDELRKECEDLVNKGIRVSGQGFDLPGKRLGGTSWKPLHSSLRQAALSAAENRARLGSLLPSGSKKIGGDCSFMVALSPVQAAAMAAERRLQDNIWCGSEFYDLTEEDECNDEHNVTGTSRKRSRESNDVSLPHSANAKVESTFIDLTETASENRCYSDKFSPIKNYLKENVGVSTSSISSHDPVHVDVCGSWQCTACTLVNPPLAPVCGLCEAKKPGDISQKTLIWSCKFCTCENDVKVDKCSVCDSWRYSYGPPVSASAPNLGT